MASKLGNREHSDKSLLDLANQYVGVRSKPAESLHDTAHLNHYWKRFYDALTKQPAKANKQEACEIVLASFDKIQLPDDNRKKKQLTDFIKKSSQVLARDTTISAPKPTPPPKLSSDAPQAASPELGIKPPATVEIPSNLNPTRPVLTRRNREAQLKIDEKLRRKQVNSSWRVDQRDQNEFKASDANLKASAKMGMPSLSEGNKASKEKAKFLAELQLIREEIDRARNDFIKQLQPGISLSQADNYAKNLISKMNESLQKLNTLYDSRPNDKKCILQFNEILLKANVTKIPAQGNSEVLNAIVAINGELNRFQDRAKPNKVWQAFEGMRNNNTASTYLNCHNIKTIERILQKNHMELSEIENEIMKLAASVDAKWGNKLPKFHFEKLKTLRGEFDAKSAEYHEQCSFYNKIKRNFPQSNNVTQSESNLKKQWQETSAKAINKQKPENSNDADPKLGHSK